MQEDLDEPHEYKAIPGSENRKGTLYTSVINLSLSAMGAGILTLPYALAQSGVLLGTVFLVMFGVTSDMSLLFLVRGAQAVGAQSFEELGLRCYGTIGKNVVSWSLLILLLLAEIILTITFAELLANIFQGQLGFRNFITSFEFFALFIPLILTPLTLFDNLTSLAYFSSFGVLAFFYTLIVLLYGVVDIGVSSDVEYFADERIGHFMRCFSLQSLSFCCQFNIISIRNELKDRSQISTVCHFSMALCTLVYAVFGIAGYVVCGDATQDNVLTTWVYDKHTAFEIATAAVAFANIIKYPLLLLPLRSTFNSEFFTLTGSQTFILLETVLFNLTIGLCSVGLKNMTKAFDLLGCTAGVAICFILPGLFYYRAVGDRAGLFLVFFGFIVGLIILFVTIDAW